MAEKASLDLGALRSALAKEPEAWSMSMTTMTALTEGERRLRLGVPPTPGLDTARLEDVQWDGYMKYFKPSARYVQSRQKVFADALLQRLKTGVSDAERDHATL